MLHGAGTMLAAALNCELKELCVLEMVQSDALIDVIKSLRETGELTIKNVMEGVFAKSISEMKTAIAERMPTLREELEIYSACNDNGDRDLPKLVRDVPEKYGYGYMDVKNFSKPARIDLANLDTIDPAADIRFTYAPNTLVQTITVIRHPGLYSRLFKHELKELGRKMGNVQMKKATDRIAA